MPDNFTDKPTDVIVLGAGIVGVSAAIAARQRGLSVMLVDRREPGNETSYGNAGILSSGSISPLNKPSLWRALPTYLTNRNAALRWDPIWAIRNIDWIVRFLANAIPSRTRPRATALHGLIGASLKLHREWIVKADAAAAHPRNRLAEGVAQRRRWCGEGRAGLSRRIWHRQPAARPSSHFRDRAEHRARLQGRPPAHPDRLGQLAGRRGQGLCADVRWIRVARSASRTSGRSCPTAKAGAWCSPTAEFRRAMSWSRWDRGRRTCCGRLAIVFPSPSNAATIANSSRTRHVHCNVRSMTPKAVS